MDIATFFHTENRKKVGRYLISEGSHFTSWKGLARKSSVKLHTARDIITKAAAEALVAQTPTTQDGQRGVQIELLPKLVTNLAQLRDICFPKEVQADCPLPATLALLQDPDYAKRWPLLFALGWRKRLTKILCDRLQRRGISTGGIQDSLEHIEHMLSDPALSDKGPQDLLMHFFRALDRDGYIPIPLTYVPSELTDFFIKTKG